jgi:hypothetical protein
MNEKLDEIKRLVDGLKEREQRALNAYLRRHLAPHPLETKWGLTADVILGAIDRAPDITQRGIRGVIAEAVFETEVLPFLTGWENVKVESELPYDFKLKERGEDTTITIQVKLQRSERGAPKRGTGLLPKDFFIVEVQKTRSGTKAVKPAARQGTLVEQIEIQTRPYSFGDFDVLAVNMHPATQDWSRFMYTLGSWLIPREGQPRLIEIMQPVSATRTNLWTDSLEECIAWFKAGERRLIYDLAAARRANLRKEDQDH